MIDGFSVLDSSGNLKIAGVAGATGATGSTGTTGADGTTFRDRHFGWFFRNANGTSVVLGVSNVGTESTTGSNVQDTRNSWRRFTTSGAGTAKANYFGNEAVTYADHGPYWSSRIRMGSAITAQRDFFGFVNCVTNTSTPRDFDNADTQTTAGLRCIAFRFSSVAGDTGFTPISWDGSSQTAGTTLSTVATSTEYLLEIQVAVGGATATFYVTKAGASRVSTSINIGSACLLANSSLNALVPYGVELYETAAAAKTIDCGGCFWDSAGRND